MAKAKLECLERSTSGLFMNCNNDCENCRLNYDQGNVGEQKELLKMMITILNQGPVYLPPCVDCNTKMNEIREAYDKLKDQVPCENKLAIERYQDLVDYFGDKDIAKTILGDRKEFKRWLDRIKWHVRKVDELARKLEQDPCEDAVSREAALGALNCEISGRIESDIDLCKYKREFQEFADMILKAQEKAIRALPSVTPTHSGWIPIVKREPTQEEKDDYFANNGEELCFVIENEMPLNGQEVLVSVGEFVSEDVFDEDYYNFESMDLENVDAWMPRPTAYAKEMEITNGKN
jgi:hypothetical protein